MSLIDNLKNLAGTPLGGIHDVVTCAYCNTYVLCIRTAHINMDMQFRVPCGRGDNHPQSQGSTSMSSFPALEDRPERGYQSS